LQIAARHIKPRAVAEDVIQRVFKRDMHARCADRNDQLHLVMQVGCTERIGNRFARANNGLRGFHEIKRRLAVNLVAHFDGMCGVIAANAEDSAHRKARLFAEDGKRRIWRKIKEKSHGILSMHGVFIGAGPFESQRWGEIA